MAFFLPELLPDIDMTKPPEFLEQELAKIIPVKTAKGRRSIDKLVKVWLKNGEEKWLFIHIEVQSWDDPHFMERLFTYFYRIYDSKGKVSFFNADEIAGITGMSVEDVEKIKTEMDTQK